MLLILQSCGTTNGKFSKREFKKSRTIASYSGMENEFEDAYLVLKEKGYFKFYEKVWPLFNLRLTPYFGTYLQKNDTLYLSWIDTDPKEIAYYISNKCVVDSSEKRLWFVDETTNKRLWDMRMMRKK